MVFFPSLFPLSLKFYNFIKSKEIVLLVLLRSIVSVFFLFFLTVPDVVFDLYSGLLRRIYFLIRFLYIFRLKKYGS